MAYLGKCYLDSKHINVNIIWISYNSRVSSRQCKLMVFKSSEIGPFKGLICQEKAT